MNGAPIMGTKPTLLSWIPYAPDEWRQLARGLSIEEEGALVRAMRIALEDRDQPCTLVDTPAAWENLLGSRWRKLVDVVRRYFTPITAPADVAPYDPPRVRWEWLWASYQAQVERYERRRAAGREGGHAKAHRPRRSDPHGNAADNASSNATGNATDKGTQKLDGGNPPALTSRGDSPPAPDGRGAALEGAPPPGGDATGHSNGVAPAADDVQHVERADPFPRPLFEALGMPRRALSAPQLAAWAETQPDLVTRIAAAVDAELGPCGDDVLLHKTREIRIRSRLQQAYQAQPSDVAGLIATLGIPSSAGVQTPETAGVAHV